jgi:hypothetical protein
MKRAVLSEGRHSVSAMSVTMANLKQQVHHRDWAVAVDSMTSPPEVVVMHRSVGIARLPYAAETGVLIAWLVQVGVPEGTGRALAVQLAGNSRRRKYRVSDS